MGDDDRRIDGPLTEEERKQIIKDALKEWLDEQFTKFGKWSFYSIMSLALVTIAYVALHSKGWIQ